MLGSLNPLASVAYLLLLGYGMDVNERELWVIILPLLSVISFFTWIGNLRLSRLILDTPTSKIASAAQGYVELTGTASQPPETPLFGKLTQLPCVWYSYSIEKKRSDDKGYETVERGTSDETFLLDDGSGRCFVDPEFAEVITSHKQTWDKDDYRYSESLLTPQDTLYVIGEFATVGGANSDLDAKGDLNALLTEWKRDQKSLHERFDRDRDGQIDPREWKLAVLEAKREVARQHLEIRLSDGTSVLRQPRDKRLFLISNLPEKALASEYVGWGVFHLLAFLATGGVSVYLLGV